MPFKLVIKYVPNIFQENKTYDYCRDHEHLV